MSINVLPHWSVCVIRFDFHIVMKFKVYNLFVLVKLLYLFPAAKVGLIYEIIRAFNYFFSGYWLRR